MYDVYGVMISPEVKLKIEEDEDELDVSTGKKG